MSGVFKGNGKEAKLAFVSVHKGEPLGGKPTRQGFSSIGKVQLSDFRRAGGMVRCRLRTNGEVKSVGELWELNITFAAAAK